ncbi:MAG: LptF/LptG family permease, partial [Armatimonadetes bacterium]|nr:LptF/LptG family permease [Armatimonadota bacterium]
MAAQTTKSYGHTPRAREVEGTTGTAGSPLELLKRAESPGNLPWSGSFSPRSFAGILDRYLVKELILPWVVGVVAFLVIFLGHTLYQIVDMILNRGIPAIPVAQMLLYRVPAVCVLALPVATLLSISLVINRMEREFEISAMRTGGVSLLRIALPLFGFGGLMTLASYTLNEKVAPWANHRSENIVRQILLSNPMPMIQENKYFKASEDYYFYVHRFDPDKNVLEDIMVYERQPGTSRFPRVYIAKRAFERRGVWHLVSCRVHEFDEEGHLKLETTEIVKEITFNFGQSIRSFSGETRGPTEMPADELKRQIKLFDRGGIDVHSMEVDYYMKFSVPCACFVLALLAFPLSRRWARAGSFMGILITVLLVFLYNGLMGWSRA